MDSFDSERIPGNNTRRSFPGSLRPAVATPPPPRPTTTTFTSPSPGKRYTRPLQEKKQAQRAPPATPGTSTRDTTLPALVTPQQQPIQQQQQEETCQKETIVSCSPLSVPETDLPRQLLQQHPPRTKMVYLIRHGESKGQTIADPRLRRSDPSLIDCGLSHWGRQQAMSLADLGYLANVDLILSSPLTRALQTAVLAFAPSSSSHNIGLGPKRTIFVHYDLREIGTASIPENQPRDMKLVLQDVGDCTNIDIDTQTFAPKFPWPQHHDRTPKVLRRDQVKHIFRTLTTGPYQTIAVFCHYHVIRAALTDSRGFCCDPNLSPPNAVPLPCFLTPQGQLVPCGTG